MFWKITTKWLPSLNKGHFAPAYLKNIFCYVKKSSGLAKEKFSIWNVSTAAGAPVKKIPVSLQSHQKPPGEAVEHTELIFFPSKQVYQWAGSLFLNHLIARNWLGKKKKKLQSNTFKMSFTDLPRKVLDFCEEKNILLFIGNNEHYAAVSTSHTFKQSFIYSVNI